MVFSTLLGIFPNIAVGTSVGKFVAGFSEGTEGVFAQTPHDSWQAFLSSFLKQYFAFLIEECLFVSQAQSCVRPL